VLYGLVPLVWLFGPQIWLLYAVLPLCEAVGMLFAVGYVTVVRGLVGTERLTEANGRLNATAAAAGVLGPLCAGLVAAWSGPAAAVGVDAASFGVSAACLAFVRLRGRPGKATERSGLWRDLRTGIDFLRGHPVLRALTALLFVFSFLTLGLNDLVIYHLKHDLAVAALTAAFLACVGMAGTCSMSLRQEVTPEPLLGRVTSAFWTLQYAAAPIGAAVLTWAAEQQGTTPVSLVAGACCVLIAGAALFTPIRRSGSRT